MLQAAEIRLAEKETRENELIRELEQAREVQIMIANKMKDDINHVRDEWQQLLSEKELEFKKYEASESLRIKNIKSELNLQHQKSM